MHEIWPIVTDNSVAYSVSVCRSVTRLRHAKMAEWIKVLFRVETLGGSRHIVLDQGLDDVRREGNEWGNAHCTVYNACSESFARWRHRKTTCATHFVKDTAKISDVSRNWCFLRLVYPQTSIFCFTTQNYAVNKGTKSGSQSSWIYSESS